MRLRGSASTAPKMAEKPPGEQVQEKFAELSKGLTGMFEGLKAKVEETVEDMTGKPGEEKNANAEKAEDTEDSVEEA